MPKNLTGATLFVVCTAFFAALFVCFCQAVIGDLSGWGTAAATMFGVMFGVGSYGCIKES